MFVINAPKNKIDKNKIREEKQEKIKELQQRFLDKNKEISKTTSKNNVSKIISDSVYNKSKVKMDEDLKQQLNNVNKKLEKSRENEKKYKDTIFKLKTNLSNINKDFIEQKANNLKLSKDLENRLIKINELEQKIKILENRYKNKGIENNNNKAMLGRLNKKVKELQEHISSLDNTIENYKEKLFDIEHEGDITKKDRAYYQNQVRIYATENSKLKKQLLDIEQEYKEKIKNLVNSDLVVSQLRDEVNKIRIKKFGNRNKIKNTLGYLKTINNFVFFESIDKNKYLANIDLVEFSEMACCRATIINNIAKITRIYDDKEIFIKELKENGESKRIKKEKRDFSYDENFNYENHYNVLIIGSENKGEYTSVLRKAGINVTWFNSYEANVVRLKNMLDRHDIIICCTRHSRHYASYLMTYMQEHDNNNAIKYNLMNKDNVENIITRVRYCIENL